MFYNKAMPFKPYSSPRRPAGTDRRAGLPRKPKSAAPPPLDYAEALLIQMPLSGLPAPQREFIFHKKRKWRFDLAWPDLLIAVEVEGGIWTGGRHVRGEGYEADCEKYNEAQLAGWMVLRFTPGMIKRGKAWPVIEKALRRAMDGEI
jgi:hypothetical protein